MPLYYQDDFVTLFHGDSLEILPTLDLQAAALLTDPPYFKVKKDAWDNQWGRADQFLEWMGSWLDLTKPLLAANASAWVFASPAMANSVERVVGERFRVLNSIRWAKPGGDNLRRVSLPAMRSFVSIWEGIIFAEKVKDTNCVEHKDLRREVFAGVSEYYKSAAKSHGITPARISAQIGYDSAMFTRWAEGGSLPKPAAYSALQCAMPGSLPLSYAELVNWNDSLVAEYEARRRKFDITERKLSEDIWHFKSIPGRPGKHPCEKPAEMLRHMIETSTRKGDMILDPFAGSGSTLDVARSMGRRSIGIEQDEHWCEQIAKRLSAQATPEILDAAA